MAEGETRRARATAAGQFPPVPAALPPELAEFLTQLQSAVREARS